MTARERLEHLIKGLPAGERVNLSREFLEQLVAEMVASPIRDAGDLLTVPQVAHRLGVSKDQVYRRAKDWPFTRRVGKLLKFDAGELEAWLRDRERSAAPARRAA